MKIIKNGFTLVEVLIVMAIMVMLVSFSSLMFGGRQTQVSLDTASSELLSVLRLAQSQSVSGKASSSWGLYFDEVNHSTYVLYAGTDYQNRDVLYDRVFELGTEIAWSLSGGNDIYFSLGGGFPNTAQTIDLRDIALSVTKTININEIGTIERNE